MIQFADMICKPYPSDVSDDEWALVAPYRKRREARSARASEDDWKKLRAEIDAKPVRIVALDLPTSWSLTAPADDSTGRMLGAIDGMLLDVLAAVARKDDEDRRRRQTEGQAKAKVAGLYKGRREDIKRNAGIMAMLNGGSSWSQIQAATGCSRATIAKLAKRSVSAA